MMKPIGFALLVSLFSVPALAWESPDGIISAPAMQGEKEFDAAAQHFALGVDFYRSANYEAARIEFQAAFDLSGRADLLHNLSMCAEMQGQIDRAIALEESFAKKQGADFGEREQDEVRGRIARLRDRKGTRTAKPAELPMVPAIPAERPSADRPNSDRRAVPPGAIGLLTLGGASLLIGVACGGAALADQNHLYAGVYSDENDVINDRGPKLNAAAISFYIIGGAAVAAGATWAIVHRLRRPPAPTAEPLGIVALLTSDSVDIAAR